MSVRKTLVWMSADATLFVAGSKVLKQRGDVAARRPYHIKNRVRMRPLSPLSVGGKIEFDRAESTR